MRSWTRERGWLKRKIIPQLREERDERDRDERERERKKKHIILILKKIEKRRKSRARRKTEKKKIKRETHRERMCPHVFLFFRCNAGKCTHTHTRKRKTRSDASLAHKGTLLHFCIFSSLWEPKKKKILFQSFSLITRASRHTRFLLLVFTRAHLFGLLNRFRCTRRRIAFTEEKKENTLF